MTENDKNISFLRRVGAISDVTVPIDLNLTVFDARYDDETQKAMAREVLKGAAGGKAAIISAPSVMNGIQVDGPCGPARC